MNPTHERIPEPLPAPIKVHAMQQRIALGTYTDHNSKNITVTPGDWLVLYPGGRLEVVFERRFAELFRPITPTPEPAKPKQAGEGEPTAEAIAEYLFPNDIGRRHAAARGIRAYASRTPAPSPWKPASEPPDDDRNVLVRVAYTDIQYTGYFSGGEWVVLRAESQDGWNVTHWAEIPPFDPPTPSPAASPASEPVTGGDATRPKIVIDFPHWRNDGQYVVASKEAFTTACAAAGVDVEFR